MILNLFRFFLIFYLEITKKKYSIYSIDFILILNIFGTSSTKKVNTRIEFFSSKEMIAMRPACPGKCMKRKFEMGRKGHIYWIHGTNLVLARNIPGVITTVTRIL